MVFLEVVDSIRGVRHRSYLSSDPGIHAQHILHSGFEVGGRVVALHVRMMLNQNRKVSRTKRAWEELLDKLAVEPMSLSVRTPPRRAVENPCLLRKPAVCFNQPSRGSRSVKVK